jgi:uncharacterized iron-regulated membrane protein
MSFKRVLFWAHFGTAFVTGLCILWMSVTGLLLTYERQIVAAVRAAAVDAPAGAVPLDADALATAPPARPARSRATC